MEGRKGRGGGGGKAGPDLLVCFSSHLTLMPKPICSPARASEPSTSKRHHPRPCNRGQASPLFRSKPKHPTSEIAEPTSPKVTCAGQIKIKPKPHPAVSCKSWQSVMEEIERLHNSNKINRKRPNWFENLGFKKDLVHFFACLKTLSFDLSCFGSLHGSEVGSLDEGGDREGEGDTESSDASKTIFSKWFMILQENQNPGLVTEEEEKDGSCDDAPAPPKNALLLMRSRSAPAKRVSEEIEEEKREEKKMSVEEENKKEKVVLMRYPPDNFFKVSADIGEGRWVVGSSDPFSRTRSWKR